MPEQILTISGESFEDLGLHLRESAERVRAESMKTLVESSALVAETARSIVAQHSAKVASSIRVEPGVDSVTIKAGGPDAVVARLWEKGNIRKGLAKGGSAARSGVRFRGNRRGTQTAELTGKLVFTHPLFGNRNVWPEQRRYPFLAPARNRTRKVVTAKMEDAWDKALEPLRTGSE